MSARWALFERFDIRGEDGELYLRRWRIVQTPWFGIYLHKIATPDKDRDLHDHPWPFLSVVLRGGYDELLHEHPADDAMQGYRPLGGLVRRRWLSFGFRRSTDAHRIVRLHRTPTWTLVFVGRRRRDWGFYTERGWVQWECYLGLKP